MIPAMATSVLASALRHARDSWQGQLGVLAIGAIMLGTNVATGAAGTDMVPRLVIGFVELLMLLAASIRAAEARYEDLSVELLIDELVTIVGMLPRLLAQATIAASPAVVLGMLALQLAGMVPMLGLLLIPFVFIAWAIALPMMLLAIAAVVHGDRSWLPRAAIRAVRRQPGVLVLGALVGVVASAVASLPIVLIGLVFTAVAGWPGVFGSGLAAGAFVPWLGCWMLAQYRAAGVVVAHPAVHVTDTDAGWSAGVATEPPMFEPVPWVEGPAWDVAVEPGSVWGTWVRLEAGAHVAFRLAWTGSVPPQLLLAVEDGTWTAPGAVARPGDVVEVVLPAGNTYVQVGSTDAAAQAITITMLVRGAAVAA